MLPTVILKAFRFESYSPPRDAISSILEGPASHAIGKFIRFFDPISLKIRKIGSSKVFESGAPGSRRRGSAFANPCFREPGIARPDLIHPARWYYQNKALLNLKTMFANLRKGCCLAVGKNSAWKGALSPAGLSIADNRSGWVSQNSAPIPTFNNHSLFMGLKKRICILAH